MKCTRLVSSAVGRARSGTTDALVFFSFFPLVQTPVSAMLTAMDPKTTSEYHHQQWQQ